jgi:PAS domain S-box-containing protein
MSSRLTRALRIATRDVDPVRRYLFAGVLAGLALLLRVWGFAAWGPKNAYILGYVAVYLAALLAGKGPGLLALAITALGTSYWILPPIRHFGISDPSDVIGFALFVSLGLGIVSLAGAFRLLLNESDQQARIIAAREAAIEAEADARRHTLSELHRTQERATAFFNSTAIGAAVKDVHGHFVEVNAAFCALTGFNREELLSKDIAALTHPDDLPATKAALERLVRGDETNCEIQKRYVRKDGRTVWVRNSMTVTHTEAGTPLHLLVLCKDISEERAAAENLASRERLLRAVVDHSPVLIFIKDAHGNFLMVNKAFAELAGRPVEEIVGRNQRDLFDVGSLEAIEANDRRILSGDTPVTIEEALRFPDGVRTFLSHKVPAEGIGFPGRVLVGLTSDITERKRVEESLRQARDAAEAANRAKDRFLASLSHELRTPLTPVVMAAQALKDDGQLSAEVREDLAMIHRNVLMEARLIDDLLDITRIAQGKFRMNFELCDAHALLRQALAIVADAFREKAITVEVELLPHPVRIVADGARLQQVFWNVLRNAAKFTPHGGQVRVTSRALGDKLLVQCKDSGIGFRPELADSIFAPFEQGDVAGEHRFGGLGLGLAIARSVVEAHGGSICADSEGPGKGALFSVAMPIARELTSGLGPSAA